MIPIDRGRGGRGTYNRSVNIIGSKTGKIKPNTQRNQPKIFAHKKSSFLTSIHSSEISFLPNFRSLTFLFSLTGKKTG